MIKLLLGTDMGQTHHITACACSESSVTSEAETQSPNPPILTAYSTLNVIFDNRFLLKCAMQYLLLPKRTCYFELCTLGQMQRVQGSCF